MRQENLDFGERDAEADADARSDTPDPDPDPRSLPTAITSGTAGFGGRGWNSVRDWRAAEPDPGDRMWTDLHVAMESEAEIDQRVDLPCGTTEPYSTPVIPPDRMLDFQREWCHSPTFRMLIRRAGEMGRERCARSKTLMGLYEMWESDAWQLDYGRFADLRADIRAASVWIDRMERQRQLRRERGEES